MIQPFTVSWSCLLVLSLLALAPLGCSHRDDPVPHSPEIPTVPEALRIHQISAMAGQLHSSEMALDFVLTQTQKQTVWFGDYPHHEGGTDTLDDLIQNQWSKTYGNFAPNALLQGTTSSGECFQVFCAMEKPVYTPATGELRFTASYLNGDRAGVPDTALSDVQLLVLNNTQDLKYEWSQMMAGEYCTLEPTTTADTFQIQINRAVGDVYSHSSGPSRLSSRFTPRYFLQSWPSRFGGMTPVLSISYDALHNPSGGIQVLSLSDPVYDEFSGSISFTGKRIFGSSPIAQGGLHVRKPNFYFDNSKSGFTATASASHLNVVVDNQSGRMAYVKFKAKILSVTPNNEAIEKGKDQSFLLSTSDAGRMYISYDKPLGASTDPYKPDGANTADPDFKTRFDKVELTFVGEAGKANLTAVDFYAIPMILETSSKGTIIEHMTLAGQTSGQKLEEALKGIISSDVDNTVIQTGGETLRILSPSKSPGSYPAFDDYLTTLKDVHLSISGLFFSKPPIKYAFQGKITDDVISLKEGGNTLKIPLSSLKKVTPDTENRYNAIYSCDAPYLVNDEEERVGANTFYSAVYRDVVTAFNLGYIKPGSNDSATWWQGGATPYQGTCNVWAKTIASQYPGAYGFPFTDRYNHILADLGGCVDTLKITLLADDQTPPSFTPTGTRNPQSGSKTFNLVIQTAQDSGFEGSPFKFNLQNFTGANNYEFPNKSIGKSGSKVHAQVNKVPAKSGLNLYDLVVFGKSYLVMIDLDRSPAFGAITGGASANYGSPNLFVGL